MYTITIPKQRLFNNKTEEFVYINKDTTIVLEHSLVSVSKWESKWKVPFLEKDIHRTEEQNLDYVRCMTITQNVDPIVYYGISYDTMKGIYDYIEDSHTATTIKKQKVNAHSGKLVTSELIYSWMISLNIPIQFEKWHLNRLITLIEVCNAEQGPKKNMSLKDRYAQQTMLNAQRRAMMHSKG